MPSNGLQSSNFLEAGTLFVHGVRIAKARRVLRRRKAILSSESEESFHDLEGEILLAEAKPQQPEVQPFALTGTADESRFFFALSWRYLGNASCQDGIDKRKPRSFAFDRTE